MTLGLYDSERRYRRRVWTGFVKFFLFVLFVLGVGLFAYQMLVVVRPLPTLETLLRQAERHSLEKSAAGAR